MTTAAGDAGPPVDLAERTVLSRREVRGVFAGLSLGLLLSALNQTLVATALPTIVGDLGGLEQLPWVVTAYLLTSTISIPLVGRLSDQYGRGPMYRASILVFMFGSIAAGLSTSMITLIIARGVQGLGGGGLITLALIIVGDVVPVQERGRYQGYIASIFGVASVSGPLLGGVFVDQLSWRWAFHANAALGVAALAATLRYLPSRRRRGVVEMDGLGAVLLVITLSLVMLLTMWGGGQAGWTSPLVVSLAIGSLVGFGLFLFQERRARGALLPLGLFRVRTVRLMATLGFMHGAAMFAVVVYAPQFLQIGLDTAAATSGAVVIPLMGGLVVASILGGRLVSRSGRYKHLTVAGSAIVAIGMAMLSTMDTTIALPVVALYCGIVGVGLGLVSPIIIVAVQSAVAEDQLAVATASNQFLRKIGGMLGVSLLGGVFTASVAANLDRRGGATGAVSTSVFDTPGGVDRLSASMQAVVRQAVAEGSTLVFRLALVAAVIGVLVSLLLPDDVLN